ncbi:MAG: ABC transporter ATP-binding protein [Desulfovibrionaceae bacterium]|nr:ABC transporter ATP-binding protein [Desulfovibrionaceae bacterium]
MPSLSPDSRNARRAPVPGDILLELAGVAKAFGPRLLFRGVRLRVKAGQIVLLAGPNGAGKSTLLRIMAGLSRPDAGQVECPLAPEQVGYLGHATFLYPGLSARENLAFWLKAAGLPRNTREKAGPAARPGAGDASHACAGTRTGAPDTGADAPDKPDGENTPEEADAVDLALRRVGLARHADERAGIFSRGMAQRLNLARVLLFRPRLLLLDEPGTGLDSASQTLLRDMARDARASGSAVVWISHNLHEDARLADRILRLERRSLTEETTPAPSAAEDSPC